MYTKAVKLGSILSMLQNEPRTCALVPLRELSKHKTLCGNGKTRDLPVLSVGFYSTTTE